MLGPLIGLGLKTAIQGFTNNVNRHEARDAEKRQFERQKYFLEQSRKYNSPAAQINRLRNAGINPDMIYGQGGSVGSTESAPSSPMGSPFVGSSLPDPLELAQINNINADTRNKEANALQVEIDNLYRDAINQGNLDGLYKNIQLSDAQIVNFNQLTKESEQKVKNLIGDLKRIDSEVELNGAKFLNTIKEGHNLDQQFNKLVEETLGQKIANKHSRKMFDILVKQAPALIQQPYVTIDMNKATGDYTLSLKKGQDIANDIADALKQSNIDLGKAKNEFNTTDFRNKLETMGLTGLIDKDGNLNYYNVGIFLIKSLLSVTGISQDVIKLIK